MRVILKPAGLLIFLILVAGLTFVAFNGMPSGKEDQGIGAAVAAAPSSAPAPKLENVDLTHRGLRDWACWGVANSHDPGAKVTAAIRKASVSSLIGDADLTASGGNWAGNSAQNFVWSDGAPIKKVLRVNSCLCLNVIGSSVRFAVGADPEITRTLTVYVGGADADGKLTAVMSDGQAPEKIDVKTLTPASSKEFVRAYTIRFTGKSEAQRLTVAWKQTSGDGYISLNAATLQ
jgi:hypothetical protein